MPLSRAAASTWVPTRTSTPSAARASATRAEAAGSSVRRRRAAASTRVTRVPRRANAWASSQPTAPPPTTASRSGRRWRAKTVSLVSTPAASIPGTGASEATEPVARITWRAASTAPSTRTRPGATSSAWPRRTCTPARSRAASSSVAETRSTAPRTAAMAARKSLPWAAAGEQGLGRDAPRVGALPAQGPVGHEDHPGATPGRLGGGGEAAGAATDHHHVRRGRRRGRARVGAGARSGPGRMLTVRGARPSRGRRAPGARRTGAGAAPARRSGRPDRAGASP